MKKVFALLFVASVMTLAACSKKTEEAATDASAVDTTVVAVDSAAVVDSTMAPADSAK